MIDRQWIDLERYLRDRVTILNETGGRGYEQGIRVFDCPFCKDTRGRGWVGVSKWGAGCFNLGCPMADSTVIEWVRRKEKLRSRTETWQFLSEKYGSATPIVYHAEDIFRGDDFVHWPAGTVPFTSGRGGMMQRTFEIFIAQQWGLSQLDALSWGLCFSLRGWYARRVLIPIVMNRVPVAFQARTIGDVEPKYLTSRHGSKDDPNAECARPAGCLLFNIDSVVEESDVVLVEGCGDVMGWHRERQGGRTRTPTAVGLLGSALTSAKIALLVERNPDRVIVALDDEPEMQRRATKHIEELRGWGLEACFGRWIGAKDAGAGANLSIVESLNPSFRQHIDQKRGAQNVGR